MAHSLLHQNPMAPHADPFGDSASRPGTPSHGYSLTESYMGDDRSAAPPYNGFGSHAGDTSYTGSTNTMVDPHAAYGQQQFRAPSPYSTESNSTETWKQRQQPGGPGGIQRFQTRKVKLKQGSVLSLEYPVPSAIQNSIQPQYRNDLESGSEEFTHMRCTHSPETLSQAHTDRLQILRPRAILTTSHSRMATTCDPQCTIGIPNSSSLSPTTTKTKS